MSGIRPQVKWHIDELESRVTLLVEQASCNPEILPQVGILGPGSVNACVLKRDVALSVISWAQCVASNKKSYGFIPTVFSRR